MPYCPQHKCNSMEIGSLHSFTPVGQPDTGFLTQHGETKASMFGRTDREHLYHGMVKARTHRPSKRPVKDQSINLSCTNVLSNSKDRNSVTRITISRIGDRVIIPGLIYLGTKSSLFVERSAHEHAILFSGDLALSADPNATRMANYLTYHMLRGVTHLVQVLHVGLSATNWPFCNIIWPNVGCDRGRRLAISEIKRND